MKNLIRIPALLLFALVAAAPCAYAQDDDMPQLSADRIKEIKAQRSAYLTTKLSLTTEQAQSFWPIYNEFDAAREKLRKDMRGLHKQARDGEGGPTEAEAKDLLAKGLQFKEQELALERTYSDRFVKNIGAVKTLQLHKAERDFNKEVIKRYRERMEERRGGRQGGPSPGEGK